MNQGTLFQSPATVPNSWCIYEPRCPGVRATLGPARDCGGCVNQSATCCKCGRVVVELSTRKARP
jgi:hypothetical protein